MTKVKKAGGDAGNNALKLWIEGQNTEQKGNQPIMIPSTYAIYLGDAISSMDLQDTPINKLEDSIDVTISSPALDEKMRIIVGQKVIEDQLDAIEMEINSDKSTDEIPVLTTLSGLAIDAMREFPEQNKIEVSYDLSVALPIKTITPDKAEKNSKRFMGTHTVIYHHPSGRDVTVVIKIEFCKCLAEGAAAAWGVVYDENGELIERVIETEVTEGKEIITENVTFEDKSQLHFDIGAGTTEIVVTEGVALQFKLSDGLPYGTKSSILDMIKIWNKNNPRKTIDSIAEFNEIYFNPEHPRHNAVVKATAPVLKSLSVKLSKEIINKIDQMKDDPYVFIYGGGAAILKPYLQTILSNRERDTNVIFLKDPVFVNAKGLLVYTCSPRFDQLKQEALGVA
jgi:plasmid segregation protein ParM